MEICCQICWQSFGNSCDISTTPCGHVFHEACIKKWHCAQKNCGHCRQKCKFEEILRLNVSQNESALKGNDIRNKYEETILNLKTEIHDLKFDKLKLTTLNCDVVFLNKNCLELQEDKNKLSKKLNDLKLHETKIQKSLRYQIDYADSKCSRIQCDLNFQIVINKQAETRIVAFQKILRDQIDESNTKCNTLQFDLGNQIAETRIAERKIIDLEAKYLTWVPSYQNQIPRRNIKHKPENMGQLQQSKSPPKKERKQTVHKNTLTAFSPAQSTDNSTAFNCPLNCLPFNCNYPFNCPRSSAKSTARSTASSNSRTLSRSNSPSCEIKSIAPRSMPTSRPTPAPIQAPTPLPTPAMNPSPKPSHVRWLFPQIGPKSRIGPKSHLGLKKCLMGPKSQIGPKIRMGPKSCMPKSRMGTKSQIQRDPIEVIDVDI